jgi:hypothetical protein
VRIHTDAERAAFGDKSGEAFTVGTADQVLLSKALEAVSRFRSSTSAGPLYM